MNESREISLRSIVERGASAEIKLLHTVKSLQDLMIDLSAGKDRLETLAAIHAICRDINGHLEK